VDKSRGKPCTTFCQYGLQKWIKNERISHFPGADQGGWGTFKPSWHCGNIAAGAQNTLEKKPPKGPSPNRTAVQAESRRTYYAACMNEDCPINKAGHRAPATRELDASPAQKTSSQKCRRGTGRPITQANSRPAKSEFHRRAYPGGWRSELFSARPERCEITLAYSISIWENGVARARLRVYFWKGPERLNQKEGFAGKTQKKFYCVCFGKKKKTKKNPNQVGGPRIGLWAPNSLFKRAGPGERVSSRKHPGKAPPIAPKEPFSVHGKNELVRQRRQGDIVRPAADYHKKNLNNKMSRCSRFRGSRLRSIGKRYFVEVQAAGLRHKYLVRPCLFPGL